MFYHRTIAILWTIYGRQTMSMKHSSMSIQQQLIPLFRLSASLQQRIHSNNFIIKLISPQQVLPRF